MDNGVSPEHKDTLEELWGPAPSREEYLEAVEWGQESRRRYIDGILQKCMDDNLAGDIIGMPFDEVQAKVRSKEFIGMRVGVSYWLPRWQFQQQEDGTFDVHPAVKRGWDAWGKELDQFGFCSMMTSRPGAWTEKTHLDILKENDDETMVREVLQNLESHGMMSM